MLSGGLWHNEKRGRARYHINVQLKIVVSECLSTAIKR
jgi:hypothetical protein